MSNCCEYHGKSVWNVSFWRCFHSSTLNPTVIWLMGCPSSASKAGMTDYWFKFIFWIMIHFLKESWIIIHQKLWIILALQQQPVPTQTGLSSRSSIAQRRFPARGRSASGRKTWRWSTKVGNRYFAANFQGLYLIFATVGLRVLEWNYLQKLTFQAGFPR